MKTHISKDLIDQYLSGQLTGKELDDFITTMKSDPELESEVLLQKDIQNVLRDKSSIELRDTLNAIHKKHESRSLENAELHGRIIKMFAQKWPRIAASVTLIVGVSTLLWFTLRPSFNERLYSDYYKPYDASTIVRSNAAEGGDMFTEALTAYNSENYSKSFELLKKICTSDHTNIPAYFFRGVSAMEINKFDDAVFSFKQVINDRNSLYMENAEWYLGLCYLKNDDKALAKVALTKIAEGNGYYKADAAKLLKELKE